MVNNKGKRSYTYVLELYVSVCWYSLRIVMVFVLTMVIALANANLNVD